MRKIQKSKKKPAFTLVEILVSMAVFSVLLAMLLQFFSGAQKLWAESERKGSMYSNARIAMNMMANSLQSLYYVEQESPFKITQNEYETAAKLKNDSILFVSKYPLSLKDGNETLYYMKYSLVVPARNKTDSNEMQGKLVFEYFGPNIPTKEEAYRNSFYTWTTPTEYDNMIASLTAGSNKLLQPAQEIISGVTSFSIIPLTPNYDSPSPLQWNSTIPNRVPVAVEIRLALLSPENYLQWYILNGKKADQETDAGRLFRLANEQTFSRIVHLGDYRWK